MTLYNEVQQRHFCTFRDSNECIACIHAATILASKLLQNYKSVSFYNGWNYNDNKSSTSDCRYVTKCTDKSNARTLQWHIIQSSGKRIRKRKILSLKCEDSQLCLTYWGRGNSGPKTEQQIAKSQTVTHSWCSIFQAFFFPGLKLDSPTPQKRIKYAKPS